MHEFFVRVVEKKNQNICRKGGAGAVTGM